MGGNKVIKQYLKDLWQTIKCANGNHIKEYIYYSSYNSPENEWLCIHCYRTIIKPAEEKEQKVPLEVKETPTLPLKPFKERNT